MRPKLECRLESVMSELELFPLLSMNWNPLRIKEAGQIESGHSPRADALKRYAALAQWRRSVLGYQGDSASPKGAICNRIIKFLLI